MTMEGFRSPSDGGSRRRLTMEGFTSPTDRKVIESILLLAGEPVPSNLIGEVLEQPRSRIQELLERMARSYENEQRGFVLREVAGGWRLYTHPDCDPWLERFVRGRSQARLTGAALEVIAIVAYKQPVSRSQIAEIRGVDSDGVVKTLLQRGLIIATGRDSGPGSPALFCVSDQFLENMGLRTVDDLPRLGDFVPDAEAVEEMEGRLSPDW
jgi:segregation and condensation protein B